MSKIEEGDYDEGYASFVARDEVVQSIPVDEHPEPPRKYTEGDVSPWSELDSHDSDRLDALEDGFIDREGKLTAAGVKFLEQKSTDSAEMEAGADGEVIKPFDIDAWKEAHGEKDPLPKMGTASARSVRFLTGLTAREMQAEQRAATRQKELGDELHTILVDRGLQIEGVELFPHEKIGSEKHYGAKVTFYRQTNNGNKKSVVKLVGSEADLRTKFKNDLFSAIPAPGRKTGRR